VLSTRRTLRTRSTRCTLSTRGTRGTRGPLAPRGTLGTRGTLAPPPPPSKPKRPDRSDDRDRPFFGGAPRSRGQQATRAGGKRLRARPDVDNHLALGIDVRVVVDVCRGHLQTVADELNLIAVDDLFPAH